jgi:hypothetical protein
MFVVVILAVLPGIAAWADVVELTSGERVEGKVKQVSAAGVVVDIAGSTLTLPLDAVRTIHFGAPPSSSVAPPSSPTALAAVQALQALRSVARDETGYERYAARVEVTRADVGPYLRGADQAASALRDALAQSFHFYEVAATAWKGRTSKNVDLKALGLDPAIEGCPALKDVFEESKRQFPLALVWQGGYVDPAKAAGFVVVSGGVPALWSCASDKLAEAERLLDGKP